MPLDDYIKKYSSKFKLDKIDPQAAGCARVQGASSSACRPYWSVNQFVYRKDIFDKLGIKPPTTFEEMRAAAKKIQADGKIKYPARHPDGAHQRHSGPLRSDHSLPRR